MELLNEYGMDLFATDDTINTFKEKRECVYKGERYSVRDNGAVLHHPRDAKSLRPLDNKWTFGKPNKKGYLTIASESVHRIVAFAFHGEPPSEQHVVDHIDTNRFNNRPENLRWLTKLENILNNPITVRKIEIACGSIEAFLKDPTILGNSDDDPNFKWMRTVTPEEAKNCLDNWTNWAKSKREPIGGSLGEWIFESQESQEHESEQPNFTQSKTPGAVQQNWRTPSEFPCCPQEIGTDPILAYAERIKTGVVFSKNDFGETIVLQSAHVKDCHSIIVMTESSDSNAIKPWALTKITYENDLYVHTSLGSFFSKEGAEKEFTISQGLEWVGGDSIDDYC